MLDWLKHWFITDRRKSDTVVSVDRRKPKLTCKDADAQLYASIDRFNETVIKRREELSK